METKKLTFSNAPEVLFEFEKECFAVLREINIEGWNLWQICKTHVFYTLITTSGSGAGTKGNTGPGLSKKALQLFKNVVRTLGFLPKKQRVLFFTNTVDKLSRNEQGVYYNSLIDPILDLKLLDEPLIIEQPAANGFLMPARHPWHIDRQLLYYYASVKNKFLRREVVNYDESCSILAAALNQFLLEKDYSDRVNLQDVSGVVAFFLREREFFKSFLKKRQPPFVLGSECMGTGLMAAALELQIPFIELQHGSIDQYYPPYIWDKRFLELEKVFKPTQLWVFGLLAKKIITATGFFDDSEVKPIGYKKIEDMRSLARKEEETGDLLKQVLVVVQPMMHEFNKDLIRTLLSRTLQDIVIAFKAHPLQPAHELQEYMAMMEGSSIRILDKSENIHRLILKSDLVVGHVTTCLEEALSLGKPSFTIATAELPQGLHSMTGTMYLKDVIKTCSLEELKESIIMYYHDSNYRSNWYKLLKDKVHFVYNVDYVKNVTDIMTALKSR